MRYYLIAGERSGDMHGANLIKAIKQYDPDGQFRCFGGDAMQQAGAQLVVHYKNLAFMGFVEVLMNLRTISRYMKQCKADLLANRPDALVLIDYAGFNLKIAAFAKKHNIKVYYYISPKVWAWNQKRALKIKRLVDHMYVILPFEKAFYQRYDYTVEYVGNPLLDEVKSHKTNNQFTSRHNLHDKPILALLPGSRRQEVAKILPVMLAAATQLTSQYHVVVAAVNNLDDSFYTEARAAKGVTIITDETYDLLCHAHAAFVTSGTATLETALFKVPQVVCYKTSAITAAIVRVLIRVPYISLVNLIANKLVVAELIQKACNPEALKKAMLHITQGQGRQQLLNDYEALHAIIGSSQPSDHTARHITRTLGL